MITKNYPFMLFFIHVYVDHVCYIGIETTYCYSYAKIVITKSWMLLNLCKPFEPHELQVTLVEYDTYLRLFIFIIWIKNPRWVTDGYDNDDFSEDY